MLIGVNNSSLTKIDVNIGSDGKLHFVDATGADTALNFSSAKSGSFASSNGVWKTVEIDHKPKYIMVGGENLGWDIYDETVSTITYRSSNGNMYSFETSNTFKLTDTGFKYCRTYSDSVTFYYLVS